jgi:ABC-type polysaccharide/polyol phosphate transport system ATPase subunit
MAKQQQPQEISDDNVIVELRNLRLAFVTRLHRPTTVRDVFVKTITQPVDFLFRAKPKLEILNDLSLTIRHGDRIGLIGVNGVGKTSLCRVIAGIYRPQSGEVIVRGQIRAIFDTMIGIFPELTGRENARILGDFIYPELDRREERIQEAIDFTELGAFIDTPFKFYSNGMQARLCLAVLTMAPTDLLILDEVFEGADQFFREKIAKRVLNIIHSSGAVVFVSHNEDQVRRVCNRVILVKDGRIEFDGDVESGLAHYRSVCDPAAPLGHTI